MPSNLPKLTLPHQAQRVNTARFDAHRKKEFHQERDCDGNMCDRTYILSQEMENTPLTIPDLATKTGQLRHLSPHDVFAVVQALIDHSHLPENPKLLASKVLPHLRGRLQKPTREEKVPGTETSRTVHLLTPYTTDAIKLIMSSYSNGGGERIPPKLLPTEVRPFLETCLRIARSGEDLGGHADGHRTELPSPGEIGWTMINLAMFDLVEHHQVTEALPLIYRHFCETLGLEAEAGDEVESLDIFASKATGMLILAGAAQRVAELGKQSKTFLWLLAELMRSRSTTASAHEL